MLAHRLKTVDNGDVSEDGEIDESINENDETLMLPYRNSLHSLLSESNIQLPKKVSQSSKEPSVVESAKVGERFSRMLSSFDDVHMLAHRLKTVDNGDVSEDGEIDESINENDEDSCQRRREWAEKASNMASYFLV
uniref:Uncharacterized protein n=1 Tax=Solanum lycopersicum TaxID=4081 RepID=A0A3Q7IX54_SOLLC